MFDTLGHNHAFFLVRILLNGKAKEGKKQEDTDYYALVFTDTYKNSIHLENEDIRYRERVVGVIFSLNIGTRQPSLLLTS